MGRGGHVGRRGRGVKRPVGGWANVTLLNDKTKSSNVGDHGGMSPTGGKEDHSCFSEDSNLLF